MTSILGKPVNNNALKASYNLAKVSGSKSNIEATDLKGAKIVILGIEYDFNYEVVKKNSNFGIGGKAVTRDEFALRLQNIANLSRQNITVILKNGKKITIKPSVKHVKGFMHITDLITQGNAELVPSKIHEHMKTNFSFSNNDEYLEPNKLNKLKKGDCNDYAIFAHYMLSQASYNPRFFIVYWPQDTSADKETKTHDICVYKYKKTGNYNYFDETGLNNIQARTLHDLFNKTVPYWNKAREMDVFNGQVMSDEGKERYVYPK